jgi:hypothetical protein
LHDLYHCNTYVCMTCITAIILNYYLFPWFFEFAWLVYCCNYILCICIAAAV